ncbi:MAG: AMP-binding protein [Alphaproteobacteria bacterium]|nr:AMP-binding protein [Alphaproteobacteria bacterium]
MLRFIQDTKFAPLWLSGFIAFINDGFLRTAFIFFMTYQVASFPMTFMISAVMLYIIGYLAGTLFIGQIADKFSKAGILKGIRVSEVLLMLLVSLAVLWDSRAAMILVVAVMGVVNAGSRVCHYALIPALLPTVQEWNGANAFMKLLMVVGSGLAALAALLAVKLDIPHLGLLWAGLALAVGALIIAWFIPPLKAGDPALAVSKNPMRALKVISDTLRHQFDDWSYLVGIAWFWVLTAVVVLFSAEYGRDILKIRWSTITFYCSGIFTGGFLLGTILYWFLSRRRAVGSYTALVGLLMSGALLDLIFAGGALTGVDTTKGLTVFQVLTRDATYWRIFIDILLLGLLSPIYITPFYTLIQQKTKPALMGRMWAFSSLVNASALTAAVIIIACLRLLFVSPETILILFAVGHILVSLYFVRLLPVATRRFLFKKAFKFLFNAKISGLDNLEKAGPRALIVTNHASYLDVLLISAFVSRKIVFAINENLLDRPLVKFITSLVDVRPLDPHSPFAVKAMVGELRQDQLCMIFTESIVDNSLSLRMKTYEGPALMALKADAPIVPIRIDGARFTWFSRVTGNIADFRFFPDIALHVQEPVRLRVPDGVTTRVEREESSSQLYNIISRLEYETAEKDAPLFEMIIRAMRMRGRFHHMLEDTERKPVTFLALFMKSFILGRLMNRALGKERRVGVLMPTSNAGVLTFLGLQAFGKEPAMINFSSGATQVVSCCKTIGLKTIITAKKVVLLAKLEELIAAIEAAGVKVVYLEDLRGTLTLADKLFGIIGAFFPKWAYHKTSGGFVDADDPAIILFTSGSEGLPKAVFLSHRNILVNKAQLVARVDFRPTDIFLNCLPIFHSFGMCGGTLCPLTMGIKIFLYPTPLHYRVIPEIAASCKATVFFGTDTFVANYAKCANPYDFNSVRVLAVGAEKLKDETRRIWLEKFGVRILEGYGATECAPFISCNTFLHARNGSTGKLMPGMECKLKAVDGIKEGQELWVKGGNVMLGYMRPAKPLVLEPPAAGWYDTGDIVDIDDEGYIFIKGRCKRFAKVGGEMVSLLAIEQVVDKAWPGFVSGAVNIPDAKKGEQIILITNCPDIARESLVKAFKAADFPEIGLPSRIIVTDAPPLLGTGKFDYQAAKDMALNAAEKE